MNLDVYLILLFIIHFVSYYESFYEKMSTSNVPFNHLMRWGGGMQGQKPVLRYKMELLLSVF